MRDDRIRYMDTADAIARGKKYYPVFVFRSENAKAIYMFGRRVYANKAWKNL